MLHQSTLRFLFIVCLLIPAAKIDAADAPRPVHVLVWDEQQPEQKKAYGDKFLGETIAAHLAAKPGLNVKSVALSSPDQGLGDTMLDASDVLIFWSHRRAREQDDARVEAVVKRVLEGRLHLIALHSAHWAKPFVRLMQERAKADAAAEHPAAKWEYTNDAPIYKPLGRAARITPFIEQAGDTWKLTLPGCIFPVWRNDGASSHLTTLLPDHPIAKGLPLKWDIPQTEMYGEPFHVPPPDAVVFEERWDKGEHFRSGSLWQVGKGRVFYFRPGHETYPVFKQPEPLQVIENAVRWMGAAQESPAR